jgi:hypothetical protein
MHINLHVFGFVAATALLATSTAQAAPLSRALSIVIDGSESIRFLDFQTQIDAYATVLGDPAILAADGSVAINVIQFSNTAQVEQSALRINDEGDRTTLLAAINSMVQLDSITDIAGGIDLGVTDMDAFLLSVTDLSEEFQKIVDVSTDGVDNTGDDPAVSTQNAVDNLGYAAVNCLGIGVAADCTWNDGFGLDFAASDFDALLPVLERKIRTEINGVPEPGTVMLLAAGLMGAGIARRRRGALPGVRRGGAGPSRRPPGEREPAGAGGRFARAFTGSRSRAEPR